MSEATYIASRSAKLISGLYGTLLLIGLVCGTFWIGIAAQTWSRYLYPPTYQGFGPFLLNSPYFVAKDSGRAASAILLLAAGIALYCKRGRLSTYLSLASAAVVLFCTGLDVKEAVDGFGRYWFYGIAGLSVVDAAWGVLMAATAVMFWRLSPNNSFKPMPLRGTA
jgi:hypothetical protein